MEICILGLLEAFIGHGMIMCHLHWRDWESWNQKAEGLRPGTHDLTGAVATGPVQERLTVRLVSFPLQCHC